MLKMLQTSAKLLYSFRGTQGQPLQTLAIKIRMPSFSSNLKIYIEIQRSLAKVHMG